MSRRNARPTPGADTVGRRVRDVGAEEVTVGPFADLRTPQRGGSGSTTALGRPQTQRGGKRVELT